MNFPLNERNILSSHGEKAANTFRDKYYELYTQCIPDGYTPRIAELQARSGAALSTSVFV